MISTLITNQAKQWIDAPYLHQGRSRLGCDCIGLIIGVAQELDILPPHFLDYPYEREPDPDFLIGQLEEYCDQIAMGNTFDKSALQPGDILVFRIKSYPRHLAFYDPQPDYDRIIHALSELDGGGKVARHILDDQFWWPRRYAAFRLRR